MSEEKNVKQFVWFPSFTNAIEQLPNEIDKALMALAIFEYGALGKEPKFIKTKTCPDFVFSSIFEACRVVIDKSVEHYENGKKGGKSGYLGGRPKNGETKEEYKQRKAKEKFERDLKDMGLEEVMKASK